MEQRTRYRITGSIFLLSMAFILTVLLQEDMVVEISDVPDLQIEQGSIPRVPSYGEIAPESDVVEVIQELKSQVDEDGYSRTHGTRFGQPVLVPFSPSSKVFAVQAGSFEVSKNADSLVDKLRATGYEAFISSKKTKAGSVIHRVAVGPLLDKEDAEEMRVSIDQEFQLDARIMELTL